jgi:predicted DNA-binding ribbon-helix-helix protein
MHHTGARGYDEVMSRSKTVARKSQSMRQSVTIPASLAVEVRRVAKERHMTISRTLVSLAERGVRAEQEAKGNLKVAYKRFLKEQEPIKKEEAGKDLIRAIFGKDAIAEDPIL